METRAHTYGDVTAHARHGTPPSLFNTTMASNQTRTKWKVIEEINQTVNVFELSLLIHVSPVHA